METNQEDSKEDMNTFKEETKIQQVDSSSDSDAVMVNFIKCRNFISFKNEMS